MKVSWLHIKVIIWNITVGFIQRQHYLFQLRHNPKSIIDRKWVNEFGYSIDWGHPRDINEKIQYLLVNTDTSIWSRLADKVLVRDYVKECGLEELLIPLLGVWEHANEIDFDSLPQQFVLKCNHDSGSTMIIDKTHGPIDYSIVREYYSEHLKKGYFYKGEFHYRSIKRRILAEKYLEDKSYPEFKVPIDYKVWCFNGEPYCICVFYGRTPRRVYVSLYDLDWNMRPDCCVDDGHYIRGDRLLPKPECLSSMLKAARILSNGFPQVRVDFYVIDGKLFFGEMTFTSMCGRMKYFSKEFLKELGNLVPIP